MISCSPYSALAPLWDSVMNHVDYALWRRYILSISEKYPPPSRNALELGGGTGSLALLVAGDNFRWYYSDLSAGMAAQARVRLAPFHMPQLVQDCRSIAFSRAFGLVVFLYDGINYMMEPADFVRCLVSVKSVLVAGGYFLFDVTTEFNSKNNFSDITCFEDFGGSCYVRHSYYDEYTQTQHNEFNLFFKKPNGSYDRMHEHHVQRVYSLADIRGFVKQSGLEVCGCWSGFTFKKADGLATRVHFLLRNI